MSPELRAPIHSVPLYHRRWFRRTLVAAGITIVLVLLGVFFFFVNWWNSPEKALLDAADYMVNTPGAYHITAKNTDLTVTMEDGKYAASGTFQNVAMNAVFYGSTLYVKSPQPDKLYGFFMGSDASTIPVVVKSILPTIQDKWVSINLNNMTLQSKNALTLQCIFQERDAIAHDPDARRQWGSIYLANRFMNIQTSTHPDATDYQVSIDKSSRTNFFKNLLSSSFYQSLTNCSKDTDVFASATVPSPVAIVTLSAQEHILQKVVVDPHGTDPMTVVSNYGNLTPIVVPTNTISTDLLFIRYLESIGSPLPQ
jgi:hypothetical protein